MYVKTKLLEVIARALEKITPDHGYDTEIGRKILFGTSAIDLPCIVIGQTSGAADEESSGMSVFSVEFSIVAYMSARTPIDDTDPDSGAGFGAKDEGSWRDILRIDAMEGDIRSSLEAGDFLCTLAQYGGSLEYRTTVPFYREEGTTHVGVEVQYSLLVRTPTGVFTYEEQP